VPVHTERIRSFDAWTAFVAMSARYWRWKRSHDERIVERPVAAAAVDQQIIGE
jgi:hypothetical protein